MSPRTLPLLVFAAMASQVEADVTILHEFRLGDDDPGALAGELFNPTTIDSAGSADLNRKGSVFYSSDVPFPSLDGTTNAFSARFTGEFPTELSASFSLLPFPDNFGMEFYVKILTGGGYRSYPLVSDAGALGDGFNLEVLRGGFTGRVNQFVGTLFSPTPGTWYHLALIRDQGVNRFYVDGRDRGTSLYTPNAERTFFQIGGHSSTGHALHGHIDEVRLFTFEPGEFSTEDLLINQVPEPATAGLLAVGFMGLLTCMRRRRNGPPRPRLALGSLSPARILSRTLPVLLFAATTISSHAAVKLQSYYRLGDDDAGAVAGKLLSNTTVDSEGSADLVRTGSVLYSSDVPFLSLDGKDNAFSAEFSGDLPAELSASTSLLSLTENFGLELFVKFYDSDRSAPIAGEAPLESSFSIMKVRESFRGVLREDGPVRFLGGTPVIPYRWYHLALVRDHGLTTFYVDGSATASSAAALYPGATFFRIGGTWNHGSMDGLIDEVRLFTFEPGEFSTEDLLINQVPEPATTGLLAAGLIGLLTCMRRRRSTPRTPTLFLKSGCSSQILSCLLPAFVIAVLGNASHGAVTVRHYYRLGDDDPGASRGAVLKSTSTDLVGAKDVVPQGSVFYSADVPHATIGGQPNTLSTEFSGSSFGYLSFKTGLTDTTDNFGLELFVKAHSAMGTAGLTYDGKTGSNGFGLMRADGEFYAMLGTNPGTNFGNTPFALNEWYHLALVRDEGVSSFYVNGILAGTSNATPGAASLPFNIGSAVGDRAFDGLIDEVRLFTFEPGAFSTKDLLINQVPEPATTGMLGIGLMTLLTRKRRRIQPRNPMQFPQGSRT